MPWDRVHDEAEVLEHYILRSRAPDRGQPRQPDARPPRRPDPHLGARPAADRRPPWPSWSRAGRDLRARLRLDPRDAPLSRRARASAPGPAAGHGRRAFGGRCRSRSMGVSTPWAASWPTRCGSRSGRSEPTGPLIRRSRLRWPGHRVGGGRADCRGRPSRRGSGRRRRAALSRRPCPRARTSLALPRPGVHRRGRLHRPGQLRHQHRRRSAVRLHAAVGGGGRQPDGDVDPDPVGQARDRHRQEPPGAVSRHILAGPRSASDTGRDRRHVDRHRRGRQPRSVSTCRSAYRCSLPG